MGKTVDIILLLTTLVFLVVTDSMYVELIEVGFIVYFTTFLLSKRLINAKIRAISEAASIMVTIIMMIRVSKAQN